MTRSTTYTVHVRGRGRADRDVVLVKDGFSWPAFFFTLFWALWHHLASELLALDPLTDAAVGLAWSVLIGFEANDARRRALARRDYDAEDVILGQSLAQAEHRFFQKHHHLYASPA